MSIDNSNQKHNLFSQPILDRYIEATITYVDTKKNVFDAIAKDGMRFIQGCRYLEVTPNNSGKINHPSSGDTCIVKIESDGSPKLEKLYSAVKVNEDGVPERDLGPYSKFMPGDYVRLAKGGSFIGLLRGGLAKIGASPLCQIIFMKLESYIRFVSRNVEFLSSGFNFYSVNADGKTSTRISLYLKDALSKEMRDKTSEFSDFEITVQDSAISIMAGPKDPQSGVRMNSCIFSIVNDGSIVLYQMDAETKQITQRVAYTPNGCSEHTVYGEKNKAVYQRKINRNPSMESPFVMVTEKVNGNYNLTVEGNASFTASNELSINGKNISSFAETIHSTKCKAHIVDADVKS